MKNGQPLPSPLLATVEYLTVNFTLPVCWIDTKTPAFCKVYVPVSSWDAPYIHISITHFYIATELKFDFGFTSFPSTNQSFGWGELTP